MINAFFNSITKNLQTNFRKNLDEYNQKREKSKQKTIELDTEIIHDIISIEMMATLFGNLYGWKGASIENVWSLLPGYDEILPPFKKNNQTNQLKKQIVLARMLFHKSLTFPKWKMIVQEYRQLPSAVRRFSINSYGGFRKKTCIVYRNRDIDYELALNSSLKRKPIKQYPFLTKDKRKSVFVVDYSKKRFTGYAEDAYFKEKSGQNEANSIKSHLFLPEEKLKELREKWSLPSNRAKIDRNKLTLPLNDENPWLNTAKQMDEYIEKIKPSMNKWEEKKIRQNGWVAAQETFRMIPANPSNQQLIYKDTVGEIGLVGAGKTTSQTLEIYRLVQKGAKVGLMSVNVTDMLMQVYQLHLVGIKAIPIIGRTRMDDHKRTFLEQVQKKEGDFGESALSRLSQEYVLRFLSSDCIAHTLTKSNENASSFPCNKLFRNEPRKRKKSPKKDNLNNDTKQNSIKNRYSCPFFHKCGRYINDRELRDADVWIGTPESFIYSKPGTILNPYDLTYYELAYSELDVLFIDEADSIQEKMDGIFIANNKVFGEEKAIFEKDLLSVSKKNDTTYTNVNNFVAEKWVSHATTATSAIRSIYRMIETSEEVRKVITKKTFGIHQILSKLVKTFFDVDKNEPLNEHPFFLLLREVHLEDLYMKDIEDEDEDENKNVRNVDVEEEISDFVDKIKSIEGLHHFSAYERRLKRLNKETNKLLGSFFEKLNQVKKFEFKQLSDEELQEGLTLFRFFVTLIYFDFHLKQLLLIKSNAEAVFGERIEDINTIYKNIKRYLPFIPESATGRNFQYYYTPNATRNNNIIGTFKTYDYLGIGRYMLLNFHSFYEQITNTKGPSMVFMSGTSFAEGSGHFHVDIVTDYMIESTSLKKSKIYQFFTPVYINGVPVMCSSIRDDEQRTRNLKDIALGSVERIKDELSHWKKDGSNRKVLLVVNSYSQCKIVKDVLSKEMPSYSILPLKGQDGNEIFDLDDDEFLSRSDIEYFADTDADVLVVPLLAINRGYNILNEKGESAFGSIFFLIRPYVVPDDINNSIKIINGRSMLYTKEAKEQGLFLYDGIAHIRKKSNALMYTLTNDFYKKNKELHRVEVENIAWYMLVNVWQMIGRLLRKQTDARVFYVDAKFAEETANRTGKPEDVMNSFLAMWRYLLEKPSAQPIVKEKLYGEFLRGLQEIFDSTEDEQIEEELLML